MSFTLSSQAFESGGTIAARFTCDGDDISPPLQWTGAPGGTTAFALTVDDPDAPSGDFIHWVLYNLPGTVNNLPEDVPKVENLENGAVQGRNGFNRIGFGGPCPPAGPPHRYRFTLYALRSEIEIPAGATATDLESAMRNFILDQTQIVGTYARRS